MVQKIGFVGSGYFIQLLLIIVILLLILRREIRIRSRIRSKSYADEEADERRPPPIRSGVVGGPLEQGRSTGVTSVACRLLPEWRQSAVVTGKSGDAVDVLVQSVFRRGTCFNSASFSRPRLNAVKHRPHPAEHPPQAFGV